MPLGPAEAPRDCPLCPRLVAFREANRRAEPAWHNGAVASFGTEGARLLIVGLAPGLRGANRTGRPFTGDYAGDLLYRTLIRFGFARGDYRARPDDGLELAGTAIVNAVRCVPPENKPLTSEIATCRGFLVPTLGRFRQLRAVLTLGAIAHQSTVRALGERHAAMKFRHGGRFGSGDLALFSSYHCSRYNTNTGVLTEDMFVAVFREIREFLGASSE